MPDAELSRLVFLTAIAVYTVAAAFTDIRSRRIPNRLTVPMCLAGFVYQGVFFGGSGLLNGLFGFAAGFGLLFVLWMIGSAGGGDVKLMGGLGSWLGGPLTLRVLLCSLIFVTIGMIGAFVVSLASQGLRQTRHRWLQRAPAGPSDSDPPGTPRQRRRVMAFAVPVALATWCVLALFRTQW